MKTIIRNALLLAMVFVSGLCLLGRADETTSIEDVAEAVLTLTTDTFDAFIADNAAVLVEFYAPWCGHCKALAPEYEKAAQAIERGAHENLNAKLAKVDATQEKELAERFGVNGFPTLKYFTNGDIKKPIDYNGGRISAEIVDWLLIRSLPSVTLLESAEAVEAFRAKGSVAMIGFFDVDSDEAAALTVVAEANRDSVSVGQFASADATSAEFEFGRLYLFRDFEEPVVAYDGALTVDGIATFLSAERFPLIDAIGPENYAQYVERGLPMVWASLDAEDQRSVALSIEALTPFARETKGQLSFTWIDAAKYAEHIQGLGITETPGLLIDVAAENRKFLFDGALSDSDDLKAFFDGYAAGTLEAHLKSEAAPEANDGDVFVLVASEFDGVVNGDRDVLVEYYAPWCGHCKALAPKYERVGAAFADSDSVVIAKADATANDFAADIAGFPTLLFYPKGGDRAQPIAYDGERESEAIIEWVKQKALEGENVSDAIEDEQVKEVKAEL